MRLLEKAFEVRFLEQVYLVPGFWLKVKISNGDGILEFGDQIMRAQSLL